ncbi:hypothetical protein ANOM_003056 [Aspergillus nomiae NRRL 13137]|uniref:Uncharacterized protein n=1 Tax=Aspergillus nomiae NRRL (strain ATCC 15546 / NRRL 13137 / CBS 260.88 / M93) TaxID=1509407 RepID=A0A0L1J9X7_ASPN3|nr:uncharacterized protein ANOM_003056 [Aspergillus nomiae NRRL 13137]KNG88248.1 hypothetical protein ANOM_003056 [Aspergillus nomiae NRRL 13137]
MRLFGITLVSAALAAAQSSTSTDTSEPCARASRLAQESQVIPAQTAYECLKSVPVAVEQDKTLIDQLKGLWEWHSETGYLKNAPDTWELGSIDLLGELDKIKENLSSYDSEYDVQLAINKLTLKTGNFHFNYVPDILQVFYFGRVIPVTTVSEDGTSVPETYAVADLVQKDSDARIKISPITKINGEDAQTYLNKIAAQEQYIDPDARFNSLMWRGRASASAGSFVNTGLGFYEGATTNITFKNETTRVVRNFAEVRQNLTAVTSGKSFFEELCTGSFASVEAVAAASMKTTTPYKGTPHHWKRQSIPSDGYPRPIVEHSSGMVAGYFMNGSDFEDVAVLKIITFDTSSADRSDAATEFQDVVKQFLGNCTDAGKKKLVIDLRENGGGDTDLLLDTFMQLFPGEVPFSAQRYRAQEQYKLIGEAVNSVYEDQSVQRLITQATGERFANIGLVRYWAYWNFVDVNGDNFKSWDAFYGPHKYNGDEFTTIMRYNMSNSNPVSIRDQSGFKFLNPPAGDPPFAAENIVMFSDGLCGSSCASFHEELKNIAGVKAIAVGGRPQEGAMQTIGGSKGGEVIPLNTIPMSLQTMMNLTAPLGIKALDDDSLTKLANPDVLLTRAGDYSSRIQVQDQIRKGDESGTPLQYIYEDADCRIFYTTKMLLEPETAWEAAWSAYTDDSKCVKDSTKKSSSIGGGYKPFGPGDLNGKQSENSTSSSDKDEENAAPAWKPSLALCAAATVISLLL